MHVHTFTLKFDPVLEAFDDSEMQEFLKDKELLSAREHFFLKHETPYLLVFLSYLPDRRDIEKSGKKEREAWRELLSDEDMPLFNSLRDWRAERAKVEKVPPYIISTNRQLALIIREHPASLAALGKIQGIGKGKLDKYGKELLALLKPANPEDQESDRQQQMFREKSERNSSESEGEGQTT